MTDKAQWKRDRRAKELLAERYAACGLAEDADRLRQHHNMMVSDVVAIEAMLAFSDEENRREAVAPRKEST